MEKWKQLVRHFISNNNKSINCKQTTKNNDDR